MAKKKTKKKNDAILDQAREWKAERAASKAWFTTLVEREADAKPALPKRQLQSKKKKETKANTNTSCDETKKTTPGNKQNTDEFGV